MRTVPASTSYLAQQLAGLSAIENRITQQTATGSRLTSLADDPTAAGSSILLGSAISMADTFVQTSSSTLSRMQAADSALGSVVTALTSGISLAVQGSTDTLTDSNRQVLVQHLTGIRDTVVTLANSSYQNTYLFSGTATGQPFTEASDGSVTYSGDAQSQSMAVGAGLTAQTSLSGSAAFGAGSSQDVFAALNQVIDSLNGGTTSESDISTLRSALDNVLQQRSVLDAGMQRLTAASGIASTQSTNLQVAQSTLIASDAASLATQLSAVKTRTSALASTIAATQKGSLFDYL